MLFHAVRMMRTGILAFRIVRMPVLRVLGRSMAVSLLMRRIPLLLAKLKQMLRIAKHNTSQPECSASCGKGAQNSAKLSYRRSHLFSRSNRGYPTLDAIG